MLKYRIPSFVLLLGIFLLLIFWREGGPWIFAAVSALLGYGLVKEGMTLLGKLGLAGFPRLCGWFAAAFFLLLGWVFLAQRTAEVAYDFLCGFQFGVPLVLIFGGWLALLFCHRNHTLLLKLAGSLGGWLFLMAPVFFLSMIYYQAGAFALLFLVLVTKMMDTGGYIVGMLSNRWLPGGNHKIVPALSPGKSWEGAGGGVIFSVGAGFLLYGLNLAPAGLTPATVLLWSLLLALGSFAGDLTESALKRAAGVKDSGTIIPGMGGVFDVLDSFLYNGILFFVISKMPIQ